MRPSRRQLESEADSNAAFADTMTELLDIGNEQSLAHRGATAGNSPASGQARTSDPYSTRARLESRPREAVVSQSTGDEPVGQTPYPWCWGNPTKEDCIRHGYCKRNPNCGD
jgi:hypothetical protein